MTYYEIFHETLASTSQQQIASAKASSWDSKHPPGAPYFLEYLPLIREQGGIAGFDPSLSYERFIPPSGPSGPVSEAESAYVRTLVEHAEQRGRIPILTDTRTLGRVAGLKAAAPGLHAILYRNLFRQWCSYTEQSTCGNPYFLDTITKIAELSRHDPVIRDLLRVFPVERPSATDMNTFYLFIFLHVHLYAHATAAADLVIDVDRLSGDAPYRAEIEETFDGQNIRVDFSNACPSTAYSLVTFPCRADMREQIQIISDAIIGKMPSERGRTFTAQAVADLMDEYERHEFYSKRLRSVLFSMQRDKDEAVAAAEEARRQGADLQSEHDRAGTERDSAADLQAECDRSGRAKDEALAAVESMRRQLADLQSERDRFGTEKDEALSAAREASHEAETLRSERDAAVRDRTSIESRHRRLDQDFASLAALRDQLTGERDAARAATQEAARERQRVESRYDALLHWSLAFHDSTAASASWRLTRPLRWVGIGRPKRPPKPDFL
ncbi:hypothetical protein GCM10007887_15970 [Methylobacterium haplocladii]|uniref:Uncharacterized protein n=1 Tax=Methylobacterium haplocladii TaxID=1176176 RepID=A0A512IP23_9HYPH|nr:hypothetical protein MHA02_18420 [Methylobacterium haplocladii]GLS58931.1 hypothetical protein GCM10007887_15970 [Methylobacterium haplocladii]